MENRLENPALLQNLVFEGISQDELENAMRWRTLQYGDDYSDHFIDDLNRIEKETGAKPADTIKDWSDSFVDWEVDKATK